MWYRMGTTVFDPPQGVQGFRRPTVFPWQKPELFSGFSYEYRVVIFLVGDYHWFDKQQIWTSLRRRLAKRRTERMDRDGIYMCVGVNEHPIL